MAVYPRWRGEHCYLQFMQGGKRGLSPLARGTHAKALGINVDSRFIPAGAGNTSSESRCHQTGSVYPRWRGEHSSAENMAVGKGGLSPLARGTLSPCHPVFSRRRFIPAGAGNTAKSDIHMQYGSVYPRWRGEHAPTNWRNSKNCGLSPLARGTLKRRWIYFLMWRFIPAGAGNTT